MEEEKDGFNDLLMFLIEWAKDNEFSIALPNAESGNLEVDKVTIKLKEQEIIFDV